MATPYHVNDGWARIGPRHWNERSVVTLQADLGAPGRAAALVKELEQWFATMEHGTDPRSFPTSTVALDGGCQFPAPVCVDEHQVTAWIVSHGEDAFDSIASHAEALRRVAEDVASDVEITWTELPHR